MSDELVTWVEIDLTVCSRRFGVSPCTAALSAGVTNKCGNTFRTCADTANYDATTETITLTYKGQTGLPIDGRYFPCLTSVKASEQTVNIAGSDPKLSALGKRAKVKVDASDFVYADRFLDPYYDERLSGAAQFDGVGYEPIGTFFARLRGRDPYFAGYPLRVKQGRVVDGALVTDSTKHYILREFDVSGGGVTFEAVDVLDLAANERAMVPRPSQGILFQDITDTATELTLYPEGIGVEYATSGYVTIGNEIMSFTRSGDVMTVRRGAFETEVTGHDAEDAVQEAYRFQGFAHDAVNEMLQDYADVPASWIPYAEWEAEAEIWFAVEVDTVITEPTPVFEAIQEMSILGFSLYTDLENQKIRFRPNRFLFPSERRAVPVITDDDMTEVPDYEGRDDERLTRVEFRSVQIDPTDGTDKKNFAQSYMVIAGDEEDPRAHGDVRYRMERTRWLNQGNTVAIRILAQRYLRRFKTAPSRVDVTVKKRKYGDLELTGHIGLITRHLPNEAGQKELQLYQVIKRVPVLRRGVETGDIVITLQRFEYDGNFGFWTPNDAPDYADATDDEKEDMAFWGGNTGEFFADGRPYYEWG